jgi:hypothetical protein
MTTDSTLFDAPADIPALPYAGTSGHSGSETSRERATRADRTGLTGERDRLTLDELRERGSDGLTWVELARAQNLHHGEASAVLSRLHQVGRISRLTERRDRCQVYVLNRHVNGRDLSAFRPNVSRSKVLDLLDEIDQKLSVNNVVDARRVIREARKLYDA